MPTTDTRLLLHAIAPWITVQLVAAVCVGLGLAEAMRPAVAQSLQAEEFNFALRLGEDAEAPSPLPAGLRDGFSFRLGGER